MYTLDTNMARKADQRGNVIIETGKYVGVLTRAEEIKAASGTKGIDFSFDANGQRCRFALYTAKADGTRLSIGHDFVMALMTVLKQREIKTEVVRVKKWDFESSMEVEAEVPCYVGLMHKPVGVLLEADEYLKKSGDIGTRMVLAGVFQAQSELTASEVLDQKIKPEQLSKLVLSLRDRPLRAAKPSARPASGAAPKVGAPVFGFDAADDDIPF